MRLRSLEIQGFKSFPDKTKLQFDDGITAVVGPNGSGKSNIADAVRWVLGEQSTKTLRGAKMEDVIFGGTQARKSVGFASVQLVIDNADKTLPDADDEITIQRKLYRSGESEYRIGGALVRLKDIHEMFMDTGLGRDGYSIIGQGRIAEIVSAKGDERREIFEEAAGIAKYRYRKTEAERRLVKAEENLVRLRDILDELEDRVGPLRIQSEKAREFIKLASEKKELEISLWIMNLDSLKEKLAVHSKNVDISKYEYEQLERESENAEESINAIYEESTRLSVLIESHRAQIKELEESLSGITSDIAVKKNDIGHNTAAINKVEAELSGADLGIDELLMLLQEKSTGHLDSEKQLDDSRAKISSTEDRISELKEQIERLTSERDGLNIKRRSLDEAESQIKLSQAANASTLAEGMGRLDSLQRDSQRHDDTEDETKRAADECENSISACDERIEGLSNTQKGFSLKRESRQRKLDDLNSKITELENQAGQMLQRAKLLDDLEKNLEGFAGSVKYILAQARTGSLRGVEGAVSSLITAQDVHILAIETALGPAAQNIIVDNDATAKRAIAMLKSAGAGRCTFLPVSTINSQPISSNSFRSHAGYVGIASELIEYDSRYNGIIAQLLGRVVIAEDMDSASAIAQTTGYKFRIVTLDGQVINVGGSFTGGSTVRNAGVLGRRSEIDRLGREAEELKGKASLLLPERKTLLEELSALDASISGTAAEAMTAQEERVRLSAQLESLRKNIQQNTENKKVLETELKTLAERLDSLRSGESSQMKLLEEIAVQRLELDERSASVESRRETLAIGAETASASLGDQRLALLAAQKDQDALSAEIARIREQIEHAGSRSEALRTEMALLHEKNLEITVGIELLEQRKLDISDQAARYQGDIADITEKRRTLEGEITANRAKEREISSKKELLSRELARLEERRNAVQAEYDGIITKLWDEYEMTRSQAREIAVTIENPDKAGKRLGEIRSHIKALGTVNLEAIDEYAQVSERYEFLSKQVKDVESSKSQLVKLINNLTSDMRGIFSDNFKKIAGNFSMVFTQLFGGGKAELTLSGDEDVLEAGIDISVQPPGKVIKNLSLLSGGEQAFVAIAIYFAILIAKPAPFCLLDEIEAALDDVNVTRYASYLRQLCGKTQFIAITHRRGTMEEADVLYGVTMQEEGVSKLLELKVTEVESKLGM